MQPVPLAAVAFLFTFYLLVLHFLVFPRFVSAALILGMVLIDILFISGHLQRGDQLPGAPKPGQPPPDESNMEWQLIQEFRRVPADLRQNALDAIHMFTRAAKRPAYHIIGEDDPEGKDE
jgi:hypothetical protein